MKKEIIRDILKVFAVGGIALLMAALAGVIAYMSIVVFCRIPHITGYRAVFGFVGALIGFIGALGIVYMCGCWIVRKGKFAR